MNLLRWTDRVLALFRRRSLDADLDEELRSHIDMAASLNIRRGMTPEQARREAILSLGGAEQTKQACREQRALPMIDTIPQDLRFGLRVLLRSPGFSTLAILCLTLGIGANAAVFSWIEGILYRPYPSVARQERLFAITGTARGETEPTAISWPDILDLRKNCTLVDSVLVTKIMGTTLSIGDHAERAIGSIVSSNYFDSLGVRPILGRGFEPGEDVGRNAHPVTVISYQLWHDRFNSDPNIVGRTQRLNGVMHTIIGVAPPGFYGTFVGWAMQFWVPASMEDIFEAGGYKLENRGARWIEAYVRLKPGVTMAQAQEEISAIGQRLEAAYPDTNRGRSFKLWPLWQTPFNNAGTLLPTLEIMLPVVAFVLLIACANVGNLLVVRSFARRHEMTVRMALGAGRGRLVKQLLTEGLILSAVGAAGGLLVAHWCRHALVLLFPARSGVTMHLPGEIDWRVLTLSAGVCAFATVLLGLIPALQTRKIDLASAIKSESAGVLGGQGRTWIRSSLVVVQVSLSFVLLVGAGLLLESLQKIRTTSPGFATHGVVSTGLDLVSAGYDEQRARSFQNELIARVQSLPGVESAALARLVPMSYGVYASGPVAVDGYQPPPGEQPTVEYNQVGPGYFATMGIPLVSGREFTRADDDKAAAVAIVNKTMAAQFFRERNPIGERVQVNGKWLTVVGVARNSKYESMRELPKPFFYVPLLQDFVRGPSLTIRTPLSPQTIAMELSRELRTLDPNLAPAEVITLQEQVERSTSAQKVAVILVGILGGLALLLAAIGLYGVMSYAVSQSGRELALRMALGARGSDLVRLVVSQGLALILTGVALGAAAGLALTRLLGYLLYGVSPRDPLAFAAAFAVMLLAGLGSCLVPAWRVTRAEPVRLLRN